MNNKRRFKRRSIKELTITLESITNGILMVGATIHGILSKSLYYEDGCVFVAMIYFKIFLNH